MAKNRISLSAPVSGCYEARLSSKLAMLLTAAVMSGAAAAGFGGVLFICAAAGILAYVMCTGTNVTVLGLCGIISLGFAILLKVAFPVSLITLLYIPMAAVIWISARHRQSLSATVLYLTVLLIFIGGATVGILYLKDSKWTVDLFSSLYNAYREYLRESVGNMFKGVSQNTLDGLVYTIIMMTPGSAVVLIMTFSYLSAKVFRLAARIHDSDEMFDGCRWPVTASLPLTLICALSSLIAVSVSQPIVNLSASNLMLITMPACSVFGLNLMFSKKGRFRQNGMGRVSLILICIISFYSGGVVLLYFASYYALYHNMREFIFSRLSKKD